MSKVAICMADGCEEIEGLTVVDVLRVGEWILIPYPFPVILM